MLSDPVVTVYCDAEGCNAEDEFGLTPTARGYDERDIANELRRAGWVTVGDNVHYCEDCARVLGVDNE